MKIALCITTFLLLIFLLAAESSNAQDSTFKLSDYKNPNYLYQSLDLNFGLNSGLILSNLSNSVNSAASTFSLNSRIGAMYEWYKNSPKLQAEKNISFGARVGSSAYNYQNEYHNTSPSFENNSASFNHYENLAISGLARFYNEKQQYFEVGGSLFGTYQGASQDAKSLIADTTTEQIKDSHKNLDLTLTGEFIVGTGRIEQVQDARLAAYILEDLQKLDRESRIPSNMDVFALAREITSLKYKRFFDNRLRKIAEITVIDSFLQHNGITGIADAAYFTSLTDNWNYANNPVRYSGRRIFTGIEANYSYTYINAVSEYIEPLPSQTESKQDNNLAGLFLLVGAEFEKPTRLSWQNSAKIKLGAGFSQQIYNMKQADTTVETNLYIGSVPSLKIDASYGFGYYPNSRTWLTFTWWLTSGWDKQMTGETRDSGEEHMNIFYTNTGPQFNAYFYLSEKLRLSLSFIGEFRFSDNIYTDLVIEGNPDKIITTRWNHDLIAALTYSLF